MKIPLLAFLVSLGIAGNTYAQNPENLTVEKSDGTAASLNFKNTIGFWHFSGPRSYETNNKLSIFWNDGTYHRLMSINDNGNVGIGISNPLKRLHISASGDDGIALASGNALLGDNGSGLFTQLLFWNGTSAYYGRNTTGAGVSNHFFRTGGADRMAITWDGKVGIGTNSPDSKLSVKGEIHAEEVKVDLSVPGPDYVFKKDYPLKTLEEVQRYIEEHGHLPNIPSAKEMEKNGVQLGEMNMKLLEKIEELTLYIIDLKNKSENEITSLKKEIEQLKTRTK